MPRVIPTQITEAIELGDLVERLEADPFDPRDEDNFAAWGPMLKMLANNRLFLGDIIIRELKNRCENQLETNQYTPQVILLHSRSKHFLIRANIWPSMADSMVRNSGTDPFFYGKAHDHNFSFLTVGYMGPGYWSEYYEYDYSKVSGYTGEKVDLRYIEKSKLDEGKVMLYRIHRDVHLQLPADEMSVSINIMESGARNHFLDQYQFDIGKSEVSSIVTHTAIEPLLSLSAQIGGAEGMALVEDFATAHPSDQIRFHALKARAAMAGGLDERIALFERAVRSPNRYVSTMARIEAEKIEKGRAWIKGDHLKVA